jgi:[citrate (pro-3S)-lyase] ligase
MDYTVCGVSPHEYWAMEEVDALLQQEGIQRDRNLDYTCVIYDDDLHVIATGSCFRNTLRCFATSSEYQGEGLLSQVVTHLMEYQAARGNLHLFLYTKPDSAPFSGIWDFTRLAASRTGWSSWKTAGPVSRTFSRSFPAPAGRETMPRW